MLRASDLFGAFFIVSVQHSNIIFTKQVLILFLHQQIFHELI